MQCIHNENLIKIQILSNELLSNDDHPTLVSLINTDLSVNDTIFLLAV